jgi:peptide/nickel transport system permease protein
LILGLISWPQLAKITRSQSLSVSEQPYVEAAQAVGADNWNLVMRHVLPNCLPPIMVNMALTAARAVLSEAGLSFLGLGDPLHWSWGRILQQAYLSGSFIRAWWTTLFPSLAIFLFLLAMNFIGIALNEAANPRLRS